MRSYLKQAKTRVHGRKFAWGGLRRVDSQVNVQSLSGSGAVPVKGIHRFHISAAVRAAGTTLTQLALDHGLNEAFLRNTLQSFNARGQEIIAEHLGIPAHIIWPDRYSADGTPNKGKWRRLRAARARRNRKAA